MSNDPGAELVDVIDDAGRTVGVVTRREMRVLRLPHRCVYLLVFNRAGELFIHLRTSTKDVYPSHWDVTVGGVLAAGESFETGVRREALEELGIVVEPEPLFPFQHSDAATLVRALAYRTIHDGPFRFQPEEVARGEFVPLPAVAARSARDRFCPDGLAVLAEYQRRQSSSR